MVIDAQKGLLAQAILMYIYMNLAIWGLVEWTSKRFSPPEKEKDGASDVSKDPA
jgi:hypothetical protein